MLCLMLSAVSNKKYLWNGTWKPNSYYMLYYSCWNDSLLLKISDNCKLKFSWLEAYFYKHIKPCQDKLCSFIHLRRNYRLSCRIFVLEEGSVSLFLSIVKMHLSASGFSECLHIFANESYQRSMFVLLRYIKEM